MLGLSKIQMIISVVVVSAAAASLTILYLQNRALSADNKILRGNVTKLEGAVATQKETIHATLENAKQWQQALIDLRVTHEMLRKGEEQSRSEIRRLQDIFARHDLSALALAKPGLVERRVNDGTARAFGMLERETALDRVDPGDPREATGAPATP